jgi:uncharacterized membrane protein
MKINTKILVTTALMAAIVFISTYIGAALPVTGYIHLGDAAVYLAGFILGPQYGLIAASIGSALADGMKGYAIYIPSTIILKGIMAYIVGKARFKNNKIKILSCILGGFIMVVGYYITEVIMLGNFITPLTYAPMNILQFVVGIIIAFLVIKPLKKLIIK